MKTRTPQNLNTRKPAQAAPDFPVAVQPEALVQLRRALAKDGRADAFVRVGVKGGGCSGLEYVLKIDAVKTERDSETVVDGVKVICDTKSAKFLKGSTLVYTGNLIGGGLKFENPNAGRSCGCGTSFMPKDL